MEISDQLLQILQQRAQQGPGLINNYKSALDAAAGQDQQSIDKMRGIYSDPSKFERSKLTSFGLGLMAPTQNGRFGESMANGLAAAVAAQDYNQKANLTREEKLAQLTALEAKLTRQKAEDTMSVYDKQTGFIQNGLQDRNTMADLKLEGQHLGTSRPLAAGEQGPVAPDQTYTGQANLIYADYLKNPQKYAGPQGQAMINNVIDILKNDANNRRAIQVAQTRGSNKSEISPYEQKRIQGRIKEYDEQGGVAQELKSSIAALRMAREKAQNETIMFPDAATAVGQFFNTDEGAAMSNVRTFATNIKLDLSSKLKGALSDKEGAMLDNASLGLGTSDKAANEAMAAYEAAANRKIEQQKFYRRWVQANGNDFGADEAWDEYINANPIISRNENGDFVVNTENIGNWQDYVQGPDGASNAPAPGQAELGFDPALLSDEDREWAREQIAGGSDPQAVFEELRSTYGTQN